MTAVTTAASPPSGPPGGRSAHEWLSVEDPAEDRTVLVDVTFLSSAWQCIYGSGCQGVLTGPSPELAEGCCSYGAHFTDDADLARVEKAARTLSASQWQFRSKGRAPAGIFKRSRSGEVTTRLVKGACIFLNRPGYEGGPGCALHRAALERDVSPITTKPDVCWQLPLRREDRVEADGHVTTVISQWSRHHWGAGGAEFHWWCTEAPEAFVGKQPVYITLRDELVAMVGDQVYGLVASYLDDRRRKGAGKLLPHPTVRRR